MEAGLVIVCSTIIGHWTQTKGGLKRIWCVCVSSSPSPPAVPVVPVWSGWYSGGPGCTLSGPPCTSGRWALSAGLAPPPPHAGQGWAGLELHMEETNRDP